MSYSWRAGYSRTLSLIPANSQRLTSADGTRYAIGRNVKRRLPDKRYDVVELWTLRERGLDGTARVVATHTDKEAALQWTTAAARAGDL